MVASLIKKFLRERKSATAVALAIMTVPLIIAAGAAVDFSRIASARTLLQASVDSAAVAGVNEWQMAASSTAANSVANAAWTGTAAQLSKFVTLQGTGPTVKLACTGTSAQCGTSVAYSSATSPAPYGCPASYKYCVVVTATATLKNSLFAYVVPSETLSVTSIATSAFPPNTITQGNFAHTAIGLGSDLDGTYAYVVPEDGNGNPEVGNVPAPNSSCNSTSFGPVYYEPNKTQVPSTTGCNYLLIGENVKGGGSSSLSFAETDPIAFTFVNFEGGNNTGSGDIDDTVTTTNGVTTISGNKTPTQYTAELFVNGVYDVNGVPFTTVPYVAKCSGGNPTSCTTSGTTGYTYSQAALYGECPAHNLYGSINVYTDSNTKGTDGTLGDDLVPLQDSINTYSSAYEVLGFPPTYATNHALTPFLGPVISETVTTTTKVPNGGNNYTNHSTNVTYKVQAVCPQWPVSGTNISATGTFSFTPTGYTTSSSEPVNVYSTYYPTVTYTDGNNADIYPPEIAGCTPATNASDGGATPTSDDPWWGWSPNNAAAADPGGAGENPGGKAETNCTFSQVNSAGTGITSTTDYVQPTITSNGVTVPLYSNCALLIQDLGNTVPTSGGTPELPKYYTFTENPSAFTTLSGVPNGSTGNAQGITAMTPFYSGTVPVTARATGTGTYTVTEPPSDGTTGNPPEDTSHQCYNPQANGFSATAAVNTYEDSTGVTHTGNDSGMPLDPVERPDLGVVYCGTTPVNETYGLYWNDMGSWQGPPYFNDDLGYSNAISEFTCPTPGSTSGGGPATLSG